MGLSRTARQYEDDISYGPDPRTQFEHDYDRIIYSSTLRRLAEVTQIFNPSEGVIFHNRLTHTIKVSQIGRRLTQNIKKNKLYNNDLFNKMGGLNEEVVASAALAHDLGNPPFGHAAEEQLDILLIEAAKKAGLDIDGFEGNAQSFRIVTKLARHGLAHIGMNLTRAVLNGMLKYPYKRPQKDKCKFGVYSTELESFNFAREKVNAFGTRKCLEAAIMDISDDISYGIHDFLDLVKSDLIPLQTYSRQVLTLKRIIDDNPKLVLSYLENPNVTDFKNLIDILEKEDEEWAPTWKSSRTEIIRRVIKFFDFYGYLLPIYPYRGARVQKLALKTLERFLITRFIDGVRLSSGEDYSKTFLYLDKTIADDLIIIKALTKNYIFHSPSLIKQQHGERRIITEIFNAYREAIIKPELRTIIPTGCREELEQNKIIDMSNPLAYRIIGDAISSLTDSEAISTFAVLTGVQPGSIFDKMSI
jgi:dGTPase